jgi:hypothetical protein
MLLDNLPHLATAKKRTRTRDSMLGSKDSYTTVFTNRACWRQPASDSEKTRYQQRDITVSHKVYFAEDPVINESHVLYIEGNLHSVRSVAHPDKSVGLGIIYRVMVNLEENV